MTASALSIYCGIHFAAVLIIAAVLRVCIKSKVPSADNVAIIYVFSYLLFQFFFSIDSILIVLHNSE